MRKINPEIRKCVQSAKPLNSTTFAANSAVFPTLNWLLLAITTLQKCFCCSKLPEFDSDTNWDDIERLQLRLFVMLLNHMQFLLSMFLFGSFLFLLNFLVFRNHYLNLHQIGHWWSYLKIHNPRYFINFGSMRT